MDASKLILVEGIPGTGKSTAAQAIARELNRHGIPVKWWYEEEKGHPVYLFQDESSMERVVQDLKEGHFETLLTRGLEQWRAFARQVVAGVEIVVMDGCLLGYLTWSLFPAGAEETLIAGYVEEVGRILAPCRPKLIHLASDDVEAMFRHVCSRRGAGTEARFVQQAIESEYGHRHRLEGFPGLVRYWERYQSLSMQWLQPLQVDKLFLQRAELNFPETWAKLSGFLEAALVPEAVELPPAPFAEQPELTGFYSDGAITCRIWRDGETYRIDGFRSPIWPNTPLIPLHANRFQLESLPFTAEFHCNPSRLQLSGSELFSGFVNHTLQKC